MSTQIETHYVQTYKNNVELLAQQMLSVLEPFVEKQPCEGTAVAVRDQYGSVEAREKTERNEDTKYSDTPRQRRWLLPREFYTAEMYDRSDLIRMLTDPQSPLVRAHVAGMNRAKDKLILEAFFASAATGELPTSGTTAYDTGNDIAADIELPATPAGLTPTKLIKGKGRLMRNQVDVSMEMPILAVPTKGWEDMFGNTTFISSDYNTGKPLQNAPRALNQAGVDIVQLEHPSFPVNSTTEWYCPLFVKSGIVLGVWHDTEVEVQKMPQKVSSWEVKVTSRFAVTRVDEKKIVRVKIKYS